MSPPTTINADEVVKKLRDELKDDLASTLREFQERPNHLHNYQFKFHHNFQSHFFLQANHPPAEAPHLPASSLLAVPKAPLPTRRPRSRYRPKAPSQRRHSRARSVDKRALSVPRSPRRRSHARPRRLSRPKSTRRRSRSTHGHSPTRTRDRFQLRSRPRSIIPPDAVRPRSVPRLAVAMLLFVSKLPNHHRPPSFTDQMVQGPFILAIPTTSEHGHPHHRRPTVCLSHLPSILNKPHLRHILTFALPSVSTSDCFRALLLPPPPSPPPRLLLLLLASSRCQWALLDLNLELPNRSGQHRTSTARINIRPNARKNAK